MSEAKETAERFVRRLADIYGDALVSALLYGSAARGDYRAGVSDLNVLVILGDLDLPSLRRAASVVGEWAEAGNPPPLLLTESEWRNSADVFPIEYSDIRDSHILLAGRDPLVDLHIHRDHLRLQLEHELRSTKIRLREGLLAAGESQEHVGSVLIGSLPSFLTMFRAVLRLAGVSVPVDPARLVEAVSAPVGFAPGAFLEVVRRRAAATPYVPAPDDPTPAGYLAAVERTTRWLDDFALPPDPGAEV